MTAIMITLPGVDLALNRLVGLLNKARSPESPWAIIDDLDTIASYEFKVYTFKFGAVV